MNKQQQKKLTEIFSGYPKIKLVYFFGSRATGEDGPMSDYDFALYLDEKDKRKIFEIQCAVIGQLSLILKTDAVDVVVLNTAENIELKYDIIREGKLIYEVEPFKVLLEPRILHEYFDFRTMLRKYNLTKA